MWEPSGERACLLDVHCTLSGPLGSLSMRRRFDERAWTTGSTSTCAPTTTGASLSFFPRPDPNQSETVDGIPGTAVSRVVGSSGSAGASTGAGGDTACRRPLTDDLALVFGNETTGVKTLLGDDLISGSDLVAIPLVQNPSRHGGDLSSLNLSNSVSMVVWEAYAQRERYRLGLFTRST
eukprot:TRINITY_DN194_c0_g2_i2.p2 TRINITY_DN194_c0_g2~~TRINITY_DN194_c0_g2_i2.p2  ORF type:complete len:179 (+),score=10.93 TRINITY_DN194_c0_g2_i2:234-770(+)